MNAERTSTVVDEIHAADRCWRRILPDGLAEQALAVAIDIGQRLCDPAAIARQMPDPPRGTGPAVLFGQLDQLVPERGWAERSHDCLAGAVHTVRRTEPGFLGLFGGLCEVAFAADTLSREGTRYRRLLDSLDGPLAVSSTALGELLTAHPAGQPFRSFDVISGGAGVGAYLLCRNGDERTDAALRSILTGLVAICDERAGLPNWHTPAAAMVQDTPLARSFPDGVFNCGLAHGIPGPLALLALAERVDISVSGQPDAIERVASWLIAHRADDEWGPNWPTAVSLPDPAGAAPPSYGPTHNAWCYGSPGVARSLWLAGTALRDNSLRTLAVDTMTAVYARPPHARRSDHSPGLCHGVAGLLQITLRFAQDTGDAAFVRAAAELTTRLLSMFRPETPFGYVALAEGGATANDPGLLDGAAGIALALLAAATDIPPIWDRTLLLA
ncbi:lanthionine synthetase C family protein [Nocardia sp. NPDC057030]|uniref:lanthionine synthetase C family protein n=1 Tax=unclassified Nocardia TaxID=2637762 RepID=UPI00364010DA